MSCVCVVCMYVCICVVCVGVCGVCAVRMYVEGVCVYATLCMLYMCVHVSHRNGSGYVLCEHDGHHALSLHVGGGRGSGQTLLSDLNLERLSELSCHLHVSCLGQVP